MISGLHESMKARAKLAGPTGDSSLVESATRRLNKSVLKTRRAEGEAVCTARTNGALARRGANSDSDRAGPSLAWTGEGFQPRASLPQARKQVIARLTQGEAHFRKRDFIRYVCEAIQHKGVRLAWLTRRSTVIC